jgi:hypothetical protein
MLDRVHLEALIGRLEVWALIFGALVAIGVVGESVYGIRLWWNNRKLQAMQSAESDSLRAEIAKLGNTTAEANARAAEANQKFESERIARLKLEQRLAPRVISMEQANIIGALLKRFSGQKYVFVTYQDDKEAMEFAGQINTVLSQMAGWTVEQSKGFLAFTLEFNVTASTDPAASDKTRDAAAAMAKAFSSVGIPATSAVTPGSTGEPDTIQVRVGKKP